MHTAIYIGCGLVIVSILCQIVLVVRKRMRQWRARDEEFVAHLGNRPERARCPKCGHWPGWADGSTYVLTRSPSHKVTYLQDFNVMETKCRCGFTRRYSCDDSTPPKSPTEGPIVRCGIQPINPWPGPPPEKLEVGA